MSLMGSRPVSGRGSGEESSPRRGAAVEMQSHYEDTAALVLAAGAGTRMGDNDRAKVCWDVVPGVSAIRFLVAQLKAAGIHRIAVVVGDRAEQVMQDVAPTFPDIAFAYQPHRRGTGHATWCGLQLLAAMAGVDTVLVAMGDKMTVPAVVRGLLDTHHAQAAALTFAASPAGPDSEQGRVVTDDDGRVLGIVEAADLAACRAWRALQRAFADADPLPGYQVCEIIDAHLPPSGRVPAILRLLREAASEAPYISRARAAELCPNARATIDLPGAAAEPEWVEEHSGLVNEALYAFSRPALEYALSRLSRDTAQGEVYLTDAVGVLVRSGGRFPVRVHQVERERMGGYNTPDQLAALRERVAQWLSQGLVAIPF